MLTKTKEFLAMATVASGIVFNVPVTCGVCGSKTAIKRVKCVICNIYYHKSCVSKLKSVKKISPEVIMCCEATHDSNIIKQDDTLNTSFEAEESIMKIEEEDTQQMKIRYLKLIIKEKNAMIHELQEKNRLMQNIIECNLHIKHSRPSTSKTINLEDSIIGMNKNDQIKTSKNDLSTSSTTTAKTTNKQANKPPPINNKPINPEANLPTLATPSETWHTVKKKRTNNKRTTLTGQLKHETKIKVKFLYLASILIQSHKTLSMT